MAKLVTIVFSHYNEKARWALDRFGVKYQEERWMPMFHGIGTIHHLGSFDKVSTPFATPVFIADDERVIRGSSAIARWASDNHDGSLYPEPEREKVARLEAQLSNRLGAASRRVAYFHAFQDRTILARIARANVSATQAAWFERLYPIIGSSIGAILRIDAETAARSLEIARTLFRQIGRRIRDRRYLIGDHFTAADLTFAALAAPLLLPSPEEGYGAVLPPIEEAAPEFRAIVQEMRASDAGQFALRMFREERGQRKPSLPIKL